MVFFCCSVNIAASKRPFIFDVIRLLFVLFLQFHLIVEISNVMRLWDVDYDD